MNHDVLRRALAAWPRAGVPCLLVGLTLWFWPSIARAAGDPELDWRTIETAHFHVHYDHKLEPVAERVASLAEAVYGRLGPALGHSPKDYTEIVLTDDVDDANGSATAVPYNTIRLYVTAPDDLSPLNDYDDWYLDLVTHEFTHIVHTDNISGAASVVNAIIGKSYAPNQVQPHWILEGLAVVEESQHTSAGRIRSSLFDMWMRADILSGRIAGLDQMSSTAYRWPQGNLWYLYGSRFLRWIIDVYGPNTMRAIADDYGNQAIPWGINRVVRRATGKTYVELFDGFIDHLKHQYAEQVRDIQKRGLREGVRLTRHGRNVYYPRFVPRIAQTGPEDQLVYYRDDFDTRAGIYRITPHFGNDQPDEELIARGTSTGSTTFTEKGDLIFNTESIFRNFYERNDLFFVPQGKTSPQGDEPSRLKLTEGLRAEGPDVSPDGRQIVFTVNTVGTTYLEIADFSHEQKVTNRRDLVRSGRWEQAYTPRFSPDGKTVAYSVWTAGGLRDIRLVDVATGVFREVTHDRAVDMTPVWSPDGSVLYFCSDRSGVSNIYAYTLKTEELRQVTNVRIGAVQPAISADGKTLVYVGYTTYGYDLYMMALDPARFLPAPPPPAERPDPPEDASYVPMKYTHYNPLPTLRPYNYLASIMPGNYGPNAVNFTVGGQDVAGLHSITASLTVEPKAPTPSFNLSYSYDRLPFDFSMSAFHQVLPRSGYKFNDQDITYNETTNGLTAGISYTKIEDFASHSIGFSISTANFHGEVPVGPNLDPISAAQANPPSGNINIAHVGYSFSNVEGGYDQSASARGFYMNFGVDWAGDATGSSYTVHAVDGEFGFYVTLPWGNHTIAWRTSGAAQGGNYARQSAYSVGGYDLSSSTLLSTITSGVFNGTFVLRGYPPGAYYGNEYLLQNIEYRFPIWFTDHGISTLPLYLRRLDGNFFIDYGGAFDSLDVKAIRFFDDGALINTSQLHGSVGGELWIGSTLAYLVPIQFRLGYARGFSPEAIPGGQFYFVASSAF